MKHLQHRLDELRKYSVNRVVKDPVLLIEMLGLYSELFLNSKPCSTCEKMHAAYYARLMREGNIQINKIKTIMASKTCELKKTALLFYKGVHYSNLNITDKVALALLKEAPAREDRFIKFPEGYKDKTVKSNKSKKEPAKPEEAIETPKDEGDKHSE